MYGMLRVVVYVVTALFVMAAFGVGWFDFGYREGLRAARVEAAVCGAGAFQCDPATGATRFVFLSSRLGEPVGIEPAEVAPILVPVPMKVPKVRINGRRRFKGWRPSPSGSVVEKE